MATNRQSLSTARWHQDTFLKWRPGDSSSRILIDAVHAARPRADAFTGRIADFAAGKLGAHCIVATTSRNVADLNRPRTPKNAAAIDEYRNVIHELLKNAKLLDNAGGLRHPFLHIAVHGMRTTAVAMSKPKSTASPCRSRDRRGLRRIFTAGR